MSTKGFRVYDEFDGLQDGDPYQWGHLLSLEEGGIVKVFMATGTYDRNGKMIFEGDMIRSKSCEIPFMVEDNVSFLIMCGKYEEKHGTPIFDSLEVVYDK